jgi:hypothetical protein
MSIIYSYPTSQPTVDDLLIGTDVADDNATKSFTVQSLVSLINAEAGSGTLTSVTISTDAFLTAIGNPTGPAVAYTIGLAATGTPSATTFLRGDNRWVVPTVSAGIGVTSNNNPITSDVSNFNFTGAGVVTSLSSQGNVNINIEGAINAVESIIASTGIGLSSETGNVIVTNTGITSLVEGGGITIATNSTGQATLTVAAQGGGTVTSVGAGDGLVITNSDATSPIIALDYTGADTYITQPAAAVPLVADLIPFHSVTGDTVNKVTFGDIQASTLALVNTSITAANADAITNTYDKSQQGAAPNDRTIGAPPAVQIVTLSAQEYTDLGNETPSGIVNNFIYLTTAAAVTPNTVNFTVTDGITNTGACSYTITTTLNGSPFGGSNSSVTGAPGTQYTLRSTVSGFGTCSFSAGTVQTIIDTIPTTPSPASVTQTVSGTLTAPPTPGNVTDTLQGISTSNISGPTAGYTVSSNSPISGTQGSPFSTSAFGLTATANTGYEFSGGATTLGGTYNQPTSTYGSNTTTGLFPVGSAISLITYDVSYSVNTGGITNNTGNSFNYVISGGTFSGSTQSGGPIAVPSGSPVTVTARIVPTGTDIITPNPTQDSVTVASVTSDQTITVSPTGVIDASTSTMTLNPTTSFTPPAAWSSPAGQWGYSINGGTRVVSLTASGQNGLSVVWTFSPNPPTPVTGYTSTGTTIGTVTGILGTDSAVSASATGTATLARSTVGMAGQGGSPGTGPDPNPSCSYSITSTAYTDSDITNGVTAGMYLYDANSGTNPYGGSSQSYRCNSVNIGGTASVGYVTFGAAGYIQSVGSC